MRQRVLVWLCVCLHVVCMHCPCARLPVCVLGICGSLLGFYIFVCWHGVPAPRRVCVYVCACGVHVSHPLSLQQLGLLPGLLAPPPQLTLLSLSCWGTPWRRVGGGRPGRVPPWVCRCLCRRVAMNGAQISGPGSQGPEGKPLLTTPRLDDGHLLLPTDSTFSPARLFSSGVLAPASVFHSALPRVCVLASARRTGRDPPWQFLIHLPGPTMGGNLGCHRSIPKDPSDLSHSRKFSAACNFSNILVNQERLNINTATEEELMTLPGVTRPVAHSIVEYREYIGGFKKVEDLALVSGVGATKLEQVKFEICVSSKGSSAQHSPSSLRRDPYSEPQQYHLATAPPTAKVNINTATPAQLMSLRGVSEKMALSLVDYRQEHGPFKSIEDLIRLEGISSTVLDKIRPQVFAERSRPPSTHTNGGLNFTAKPHPSPTSLSLQSEDLDFPPGGPTQLISTRPSIEAFGGTRDGWPVWRLATWNLQGCSIEKANNPGVREVVCMTLLENSIKLLAVQDLIDKEALEKKEKPRPSEGNRFAQHHPDGGIPGTVLSAVAEDRSCPQGAHNELEPGFLDRTEDFTYFFPCSFIKKIPGGLLSLSSVPFLCFEMFCLFLKCLHASNRFPFLLTPLRCHLLHAVFIDFFSCTSLEWSHRPQISPSHSVELLLHI
uniref:Endonuclease/exonuclease/phosphatase family domain-containing protein 1 isoform X3 n=1 Tax=Phascolarctos cinereus TaxID=38626 RepID=A0A6P5IN23_PHACI|nr:endonuclease/exonuclease/phosphatase family domain-containing protein 1 isoform X3 [Phascolarctos cinereus]